MEKTIVVPYKLYDSDEYANIPIAYTVETKGQRTVYNCKVALQDDEIPEWLSLREFAIPTVYTPGNPGVYATLFSEVQGVNNVDSALFTGSVHQSIFTRESFDAQTGR